VLPSIFELLYPEGTEQKLRVTNFPAFELFHISQATVTKTKDSLHFAMFSQNAPWQAKCTKPCKKQKQERKKIK